MLLSDGTEASVHCLYSDGHFRHRKSKFISHLNIEKKRSILVVETDDPDVVKVLDTSEVFMAYAKRVA